MNEEQGSICIVGNSRDVDFSDSGIIDSPISTDLGFFIFTEIINLHMFTENAFQLL